MTNLSYYCVDCGSELDNNLGCESCKRKYDKISGIPVLLSTEDMNSELFQRYLKNYDEIVHDDIKKSFVSKHTKKRQFDIMLRFMGYISQKDKVIDVGCGLGEILSGLNCKVKVGCDIALEYLISLEPQITPILCNVEKLPFKNEFDLAICTSVLEHVLDPHATLENIYNVLKKDGKLYVRVPIEKDLSRYANQKYEFTHLRTFDKERLIKMLEETGFKVKRTKRIFSSVKWWRIFRGVKEWIFNKPIAIAVEAQKQEENDENV